jgi:AcrR family transcriptional regulator
MTELATPNARRRPGRPSNQLDDTRALVLEAAIDAFGRDGYSGTNLRSIADTGGVSLGTLTHHFPTKADLFVTAHAEASRQIVSGYAQALADAVGVRAELDAMLDQSVQFMVERPALTYLTIRAAADASQPQVRTVETGRAMHDLIDGVAARAIARGEVAAPDGPALKALVLSMLWGISMVGVDRADARAASARGFRLLFHEQLLRPDSLRSAHAPRPR